MKTIIVDKNDNYLTLKNDEEVTHDDTYRVSSLWVVNSRGQILIAKRKLTKKNDPGKWGPAVSGTLEEGETYETNVYKEAQEEIGLKGQGFKLGPKIFHDGNYKFFAQWFLCIVNWPLDRFTPQEKEVEQLAWVDSKDLFSDIVNNPSKYVESAAVWPKLFG